MVYLAAIIGLIGGFALSIMVLSFLLRGVKKEDLLNDPYIKWKYGLLAWAISFLGAYAAVEMYQSYFAP